MEIEPRVVVDELKDRQDQFGVLIDISPEKLRGLEFCTTCRGEDYEWTDWSRSDIDHLDFDSVDGAIEYRTYLAESACEDCDGTGFEGGSFELTKEQWLEFSLIKHPR